MLVSFFCKPLWVPFNRFREPVQSGHLMRREVVAYYSSCPSLWFLVAPHPAPLCCRSFLKDLFCLAKNWKGCIAKKKDLKCLLVREHAYQREASCQGDLSQLPWETHTCIIRLDESQELPPMMQWGGGQLGLKGSPHSITAREEEHRGRPRRY